MREKSKQKKTRPAKMQQNCAQPEQSQCTMQTHSIKHQHIANITNNMTFYLNTQLTWERFIVLCTHFLSFGLSLAHFIGRWFVDTFVLSSWVYVHISLYTLLTGALKGVKVCFMHWHCIAPTWFALNLSMIL